MANGHRSGILLMFLAASCSNALGPAELPGPSSQADAGSAAADAAPADAGPPPPIVVMTMNIGTTSGLAHDQGNDGYTSEHATIADEHYHNSLSWNPAEQALKEFLAQQRPTIVVFQEGFYDPWCEEIPVDPNLDFVCKDYTTERALQVERLLGPDYQVACADGQEDNCAGVLRSFARMKGCPDDGPCLDGLAGQGPPDGCSKGARIGSVELELIDGREMTLVNVHGTSGIKLEDMLCRRSQFAQVFEDRGDGQPAANGTVNLVMGDLNTDPFKAGFEPSAAYWNDKVGDGKAFHYLSSDDSGGPATYDHDLRIDHIASDALSSLGCKVAGADGTGPVMDAVYWDHKPVVCEVAWPE